MELKFDPGFRVIREYLSQLLGILGGILFPPVTQLFRSKWLHFSFSVEGHTFVITDSQNHGLKLLLLLSSVQPQEDALNAYFFHDSRVTIVVAGFWLKILCLKLHIFIHNSIFNLWHYLLFVIRFYSLYIRFFFFFFFFLLTLCQFERERL